MTGPGVPEAVTPEFALLIRSSAPLVTVVGDLVLDRWWSGKSERLSREAPAPVVEITARSSAPGGAANTARCLAALGARVRLVGAVGEDDAGRTLLAALDAAGVDTTFVLRVPGLRTTTKTRLLSGDQVLLRVDELEHDRPSDAVVADLANAAVAAMEGAEVQLISDYGSGLLGPELRAALLARAHRPPLLVVDAHDLRPWLPLHPDIVTPNAEEFARAAGVPLPQPDRASVAAASGEQLLAATGARAAVVTLDREGTVLLRGAGEAVHRTYAHPASERLASGAGDTFVAALTLARAWGASLPLAADFGQAAADVVVDREGTSVCSTADLIERLSPGIDPALPLEELVERVEEARRAGQRIVFTNGCFDVLHRGHTTYLRQAKQLGGLLVVAVNDDDSVRRLKGPDRPVNPANDRAAVLASLECVDFVTVFGSDTPIPLIERLRPDVYAKGGDYTPSMLEETAAVHAVGGEVRILDYVGSHSTTAMVGRIRSGAAAASPGQGSDG